MASREKFRTYEDVFDQATLRTLFKLSSQGYFDELKSPISVGKESNVFSAIKNNEETIAVKIYRVNTCDFHKMYNYIRGDKRFEGLTAHRRKVIAAWAQREYQNLLIAREAHVRAPVPYAVHQNVLVMELIGDNGTPASKLKDKPPQDLKDFSQSLIQEVQKLYNKNLVHGDLSEYNILNHHEKPVLIDLSYGTRSSSPIAAELLARDIENIAKYFTKKGFPLTQEKIMTTLNNGRILLRH